jgi:transposase
VVSQVARKYGIMPSQLFYWRRTMKEVALKKIVCGKEVVAKKQIKELEKEEAKSKRNLIIQSQVTNSLLESQCVLN